jgi:hypothetical protein
LTLRLWDNTGPNCPLYIPINWEALRAYGNQPGFLVAGRYRPIDACAASFTNFGAYYNTQPNDTGATKLNVGTQSGGSATPNAWTNVSATSLLPEPPAGTDTAYINPYIEIGQTSGSAEITSDFDWFVVRIQPNGNPLTLGLNSPPHLPLESWGRIYMVSPNFRPGRGH